MRLSRCHVDAALAPGTKITLPESAAVHLVRVLRLREGDPVPFKDGSRPAKTIALFGALAGSPEKKRG